MRGHRRYGLLAGATTLIFLLASCSQPISSPSGLQVAAVPGHGNPLGIRPAGPGNAPVCPGPVAQGSAACTSRVIVDKHGAPKAASGPQGYAPQQIRTAYGFASLSGATGVGQTIAIVDAYDDPNIAADLTTFKTTFGIDPSGCRLTKVDQTGGSNDPKTDSGWSLEIALDVEWACAIAPGANILLVEAASSSFNDLLTAVSYAAQHAHVVSMSWGGSEFSSEASNDGTFGAFPDVTFTASSGDSGAGVIYPAASPDVVAVGGTTLPLDGNGGSAGAETAWSGSGGGVSAFEAEPAYQTALATTNLGAMLATYANGHRGVPDVAYDADPSTGFSVYDTTRYQGRSGWFVVGGTSAGAPQWAALFALADQTGGTFLSSTTGSPVYAAATADYAAYFDDITSGSDCTTSPVHGHHGGSAGSTTLCTATADYDFVTGLGSPVASTLVPVLATY